MRGEDTIMTMLERLPALYEYLITAIETMPLKDLTMDYVTGRLMHEILKFKRRSLKVKITP